MKISIHLLGLFLINTSILPMFQPTAQKRAVPFFTLTTLERYRIAPKSETLKNILSLARNLSACMNEAKDYYLEEDTVLTEDQESFFIKADDSLSTIKNLMNENSVDRASLEFAIKRIPSFVFFYPACNAVSFPEFENDSTDDEFVMVKTVMYSNKMLIILREKP